MWKKSMSLLLACLMFVTLITGCGSNKTIDGVTYGTHGLFNSDEANPNIEYKIIIGNVVWSIILIETVVFPVYFIGFSIYEPVGKKGSVIKGAVN